MVDQRLYHRNFRAFIWHAVFLSITVTFTEVNTVIPALILQVGGSEIHVGLAAAIMIGVPLISQLNFAGFLYGKSRKKPYLLAGINLRVVSLALIAVTLVYYEQFTLAQLLVVIYCELLLFTLGGAFAGISYVDLVGKSFDSEGRRSFFTKKQIIASLGIFLSAVVARAIMQQFAYPRNYVLLFAAASFFLLTASLGFWRISEQPLVGVKGAGYLQTLRSIPRVLKADKNLRYYLLFMNAVGVHVALTPFYITFARNQYYLDSTVISNVLFIQIVGMISASLVWPKIVRRGGFKRVLKIFALLSAIIPPAALLLGHFLQLPWYLSLFFVIGWSVSAKKITSDSVLVELSNEENRVLYTGIAGTLNISVAIFPIALGGLIGSLGYVPIFLGVSMLALGAFLLLPKITCPVDLPEHDSLN
ncbi:MAG: MFS transporter [Spirochaetota bacterium]